MSLSDLSIRRPVFAWMLMFGLILFGAISFFRMGVSQMPDVDFPVVNIFLRLDNAAPEVMEVSVVDIVEDAVMGIQGLERVTSNVSQGTANVTCEFAMDHNINVALSEVENRIQQSSNLLPTALYPLVVTKTNPEDKPLLWVIVTADGSTSRSEQMVYARNHLKDQLSTIPGVGNVTFAGFVEPNLRVWLNRKKLYQYNLTASDVWSAIQAEQIEQPAGRIEAPLTETNIRVLGEARSPKEFGKIHINTRGGSPNYKPLTLEQVAKVEEGISDLRQISRFNGKPAVGLGIIKQHGSNAVAVAKKVREKIQSLQATLLPGYQVQVKLDSTEYIEESVHELNLTLGVAAILTSIVCFLFLGSWSSTFNVFLAIPTSVIGTFSALYFFGFTLNTFTLLGLSLAIGIVVDDAIMMLENIVRHYEMGKNRRQAALDGSNEITFAAIATTLAIAAIFIPVIFMKGVVGKFFYQYGITVTVAVLLSLLEALTLTPMRCARFLHSAKTENPGKISRAVDSFLERLTASNKRGLRFCLRHRAIVLSVSVGIFISSLGLMWTLKEELIPAQDQSLFLLNLKAPIENSIQATDAVFKKAEEYLSAQTEVKDVYSTVGNFQNNNVVNAGTIYVILKPNRERKLSQIELMRKFKEDLREALPNVSVIPQDLSLTGFSASRGFPIEFVVEGPNWNRLVEYSEVLTEQLRAGGYLEDLHSDFQLGSSEIHIVPNRSQASARGVSMNTIGQEVSYLIGGQIFNANTQYPKDGHRYYIRLRSQPDQIRSSDQIGEILLRNDRGVGGDLVPLRETSKVEIKKGLQLITRVNRSRAVAFYANVAEGKSQESALKEVEARGQSVLTESGYRLKTTGSAEAFREAFGGLSFALILGIAVAYMVLASQFNSFVHPLTVLVALPFSLTGALLALTLTHQSLSLYSLIGLILLMGIVKKNSILLVDFTNQKRSEGLSVQKALLEACPIRLRPILMTSIATVAGAIPEALNFGSGAETRIPMAVCVIGGVTLSTFLTLYVVPCVYSFLSRFERPELEEFQKESTQ